MVPFSNPHSSTQYCATVNNCADSHLNVRMKLAPDGYLDISINPSDKNNGGGLFFESFTCDTLSGGDGCTSEFNFHNIYSLNCIYLN